MKTEYRDFQFSLLALAPIHIGNGEKYTSREFIYENNSYYFPDMVKFYNRMMENGLGQKFECFIQEKKSSAEENRLISFLNNNSISDRNFGGYRIIETGFESEKNDIDSKLGTINEVAKFMRDPFGNPYIPGSSLKGAIRTILLNTNPHWINEEAIYKTKSFKVENMNIILWDAKTKRKFNNLFNAIRVSDSMTLCNENLIITQKWDLKRMKDDEPTKPIGLPLYRESLAPLTKINFKITTSSKEAGELIENLGVQSQKFYKEYERFFLLDYPEDMIQDNIQYPIYLGAGSGVWTKTLFKLANGILQDRYCSNTPNMDGKGVLKLTKAVVMGESQAEFAKELIKNTESFYEMGKANFMIKEITK